MWPGRHIGGRRASTRWLSPRVEVGSFRGGSIPELKVHFRGGKLGVLERTAVRTAAESIILEVGGATLSYKLAMKERASSSRICKY